MNTRSFFFLIVIVSFTVIFSGCSSSTGGNGGTSDIPPPTGLDLKYTGNGVVRLEWDADIDNNSSGYNVYWMPGSDFDPLTTSDSLYTPATSVSISGLTDGLVYSFGISAVDSKGNESDISKITGKPFSKSSPLSPTGLVVVADNIDEPRITLSWNENEDNDIAYYAIYRATNADDAAYSYSRLNTATTTGYIDTDIEIGVQYYYRITAVEIGGWESVSSSLESDYALPSVEIISPDNFSYVPISPTLLWQKVTGANKYNVVVKTSRIGGEIWNTIVESPVTRTVYTGDVSLEPGATYYWEVGAISKTEINSISTVAAFIVESE